MNFNKLIEAIDTGDFPSGFHPSQRRRIEDVVHDVEQIFPQLGDKEQKYLEHITSESYRTTVEYVARYLQMDIEELEEQFSDINSFAMLLMQTVMRVDNLERPLRSQLEEIALDAVLDTPGDEFSMIKQMYMDGHIKFDIKIVGMSGQPEVAEMLFGADDPGEEGAELAPSEELAMSSDRFSNEDALKREFANFMMAGNAIHKMYLFHMVENELNQLNRSLVMQYGMLAALGNLGYYILPDEDMGREGPGMPAGVEKVDRNNNIIHARAMNFVVLMHEIVKGIMEYLSADTVTADISPEGPNTEAVPLMAGPEMYREFQRMIPADKKHLFPLIYKLLLTEPADIIRTVLTGGERGQRTLDDIISQAEDQWNEYNDPSS